MLVIPVSKRSDTVLNLDYPSSSQPSTDKNLRVPSERQMLFLSDIHSLAPQIIDAEQFELITAYVQPDSF